MLTSIMSGLVSVSVVFMSTYLRTMLNTNSHIVSKIVTISLLFNIIAILLTGYVATYISKYRLLKVLLYCCPILIPFGYMLLKIGILLFMLEGIVAILIRCIVSQVFPAQIRLTGVATTFNLVTLMIGVSAPIIVTTFINLGYGVFLTPIVYLLLITAISTIGLLGIKKYIHK